MDEAKKLLENLSDEEQKYISEFMWGYYKRFQKIPPKDLGALFITFGTAVIAAGTAISKSMEGAE